VKNVRRKRHERDCKICRHPDREAIELEFCDWQPLSRLAKDFRLGSRQSLSRHASACGLIPKRNANIAAALSSIVERGMRARVSSRVAVQAIAVLAKINSRGRWIERHETLDLNQLFERMSQAEMLAYAEPGTLPAWFEQTIAGRTLERSAPALEPAP
jgi:hypothetical protein